MLAGYPDGVKNASGAWWKTGLTGVFHASVPGVCRLRFLSTARAGELHPDTISLMHKVSDHVEEHGTDCWYSDDIFTLLGVDPERFEQVTDILDVWFDSGVSHRCVLDEREELKRPAQIYLEGSDQHRGWFQSSPADIGRHAW